VYHIRNGEILYKTKDHKQVLDMAKDGIITPEQALHHPWRNRLSRSVSVQIATAENPNPRKPDKATVQQLTDISPNDYFFLCTDGVLEQLTDEMLCQLLSNEQPNEEKKAAILTICEGKTKDNYTGLLVQVDKVGGRPIIDDAPPSTPIKKRKNNPWKILASAMILTIAFGVGGYFWRKNQTIVATTQGKPKTPPKDTLLFIKLNQLVKDKDWFLAQNKKTKKYGVLGKKDSVIVAFEYDTILVEQKKKRLKLKKGKTTTYQTI
jgi:hypothetical protein